MQLNGDKARALKFTSSDLVIHASADASFMSYPVDLRGQSGCMAWFGQTNAPFLSVSLKHNLNVLNTMESEGIAACEMVRRLHSVQRRAEMMGCPPHEAPITLEMDNRSLLLSVEKQFYQGSSRHWQLRFRFLIDQLQRGSFKPKLIPSKYMRADRLTKVVKDGHHTWVDETQNDRGGVPSVVQGRGGCVEL